MGCRAGAEDPLRDVDEWAALLDGRAQLMGALRDLDEAEAALPVHEASGWRIRDLIAHVAVWDDLYADFFRALAAGRPSSQPEITPGPEWDARNEAQVRDADDLPLHVRLDRLQRARAQMLDAAAQVPPQLRDAPLSAPWGFVDTLQALLIALAMHDVDHATEILGARARAESGEEAP